MSLLLLALGCPPAPDDSAAVTDDTGTGIPPATCAGGHAALVADLGLGAAVSMRVEPATVDLSATAPVSVEVVVANVGVVDLTGGWGGCVNARYHLVDASGVEVWTEPEEKSTCTQPPVDLVAGDALTMDETLDLSGVPAGAYLLVAAVSFQLDQGYFDTMESWEVGTAVNLGVGACPVPRVEAFFGPRQLDLSLTAPALPLDAAAATPLTAQGTPAEALDAQFDDCGLPRFAALDAAGAELWTASPADTMDCDLVDGWPAGEARSGEAEVPAELWAPATSGTVAAGFREPGDPAAGPSYRVELGVQTQ